MSHYNKLTPAEAERLALLAEECAEVIQVVGKILRHGYESYNPNDPRELTNRTLLADELGHVDAAVTKMHKAGDLAREDIAISAIHKLERVGRYLHHA